MFLPRITARTLKSKHFGSFEKIQCTCAAELSKSIPSWTAWYFKSTILKSELLDVHIYQVWLWSVWLYQTNFKFSRLIAKEMQGILEKIAKQIERVKTLRKSICSNFILFFRFKQHINSNPIAAVLCTEELLKLRAEVAAAPPGLSSAEVEPLISVTSSSANPPGIGSVYGVCIIGYVYFYCTMLLNTCVV